MNGGQQSRTWRLQGDSLACHGQMLAVVRSLTCKLSKASSAVVVGAHTTPGWMLELDFMTYWAKCGDGLCLESAGKCVPG